MVIHNKKNLKDEYAIVIDFISKIGYEEESIIAIGTTNFTLLELIPRKEASIDRTEKVYIGEDKRDKIRFIKRAVKYEELSSMAKDELFSVLVDIVNKNVEKYVNFFNTAGAVSIRKHSLEMIQGIGKKHLLDLIDTREEQKFSSFDDIKQRCPYLKNPQESLAKRIIEEIKKEDEIKFFVKR